MEFHTPHNFIEATKKLSTGQEPLAIGGKFKDAFQRLERGDPDMVTKSKEIMEPIVQKLKDLEEES